ncbi:coiled-coil domain-containing protein 62-like [Clytia hemisphaerica]|uniref:Coiled-coil domain-containing protein 62 n=1 Tax=Clytia hemisphaerica TaxID=252671 RepID=A0A7M5WMH2_9CNID
MEQIEGKDSESKLGVLSPNFQSTPLVKKDYGMKGISPRSLYQSSNSTYGIGANRMDTKLSNSNGKSPVFSPSFSNGTPNSYRKSISPGTKLSDVDSSTVLRQRHELQLMIAELKDRDRELNELVSSHHQQLVAWELDRQRLITVEKQMSKFKSELKKRHSQCKILKDRLKEVEGQYSIKTTELESTQKHLHQVSQKASDNEIEVEEYRATNVTLKETVTELTKSLAESQSRQQEIATILRLKDKDIEDANSRIGELTEKLQTSNKDLKKSKQFENQSKSHIEKLTQEKTSLKSQLEKLEEAVIKQNSTNDESMEEFNNMKQEMVVVQKELLLAGEREKRKDSLLQLSRSKQERTEMELKQVRKLYESLQRDHVVMKQNMYKQDDELSMITFSELDDKCMDVFDKMELMESAAVKLIHRSSSVEDEVVDDGIDLKHSDETLSTNAGHVLPSGSHRVLPKPNLEGHFQKMDINKATKQTDNSFTTYTTEDLGEMTTSELKGQDQSSFTLLMERKDSGNVQDEEMSPTARLQHLLTESRKMVKTLEESPDLSSIHSSPNNLFLDNKEI